MKANFLALNCFQSIHYIVRKDEYRTQRSYNNYVLTKIQKNYFKIPAQLINKNFRYPYLICRTR